MTRPRRPAPPPLEANEQLVAAVGTAAWVVALIVVLVLRGQFPPDARWWLWTCVAGVVMGLFGLWYIPRVKRSRAAAAARREEARGAGQPCSSGSNSVSSTDTPGTSTRS